MFVGTVWREWPHSKDVKTVALHRWRGVCAAGDLWTGE